MVGRPQSGRAVELSIESRQSSLPQDEMKAGGQR